MVFSELNEIGHQIPLRPSLAVTQMPKRQLLCTEKVGQAPDAHCRRETESLWTQVTAPEANAAIRNEDDEIV